MRIHHFTPVGLRASFLVALFFSTLDSQLSTALAQGSLTPPPGAPAPTMKTLDQLDAKLEKRTPITSVPFTINAAGSYYLISNFTASGSASGIIISADNVTVDLGGFVLLGTLSGTAPGISVPAAQKNVQVRNGTIRNWNGSGIAASNATNSECTESASMMCAPGTACSTASFSASRNKG